ncbi:MAG TPA: discoidin domain-containing protein, partial [Pyrinomonadaceae bacterium]|nr:discoidin domain-containing protein [Pyrinomonadaceae bacterium]
YVRSLREAERRRERAAQQSAPAQPAGSQQQQTPPAAQPAESVAVPHSLKELKPARVLVDSSFDGYNVRPLTDGETDVRRIAAMKYNEGNWASAETPDPHWIELQFERPVRVAAVYVYWGFDRTRFTPSRRVELQTHDGGGWRTVSAVEPGENFDRTSFDFAPFVASRLRVLQPAQQGPPNRSFIMWVREVKAYGAQDANGRD